MTFAYFCIWQIVSDFWKCCFCSVFAPQPITSFWQRAPYNSLANKTINSNVQTQKEILTIWISSSCITFTCSPYTLCVHFKGSFQLNNHICAFCHACKEDEVQQVQVDIREVQTRKKGKLFHQEDSRGTGWPCFEQKIGLETSWGPFQPELSSILSAFNSSHRDNPSSTSSVWWAHPVETSRALAFSGLSRTSLGNNSQKIWHQKLNSTSLGICSPNPPWYIYRGALSKLLIFMTHLGRCVCLTHVDWIMFWRCLISYWINIKR